LDAVVHVSAETQCGTGVHAGHAWPDAARKKPASQAVQTELAAVVHVSALVQCDTTLQAVQTVGTVVLRQ
jgi:hypothetical protein